MIPDRLIQLAAIRICDHGASRRRPCTDCQVAAREALAAAFGALPVDEIQKMAREAVADAWLQGLVTDDVADAANDVWTGALAREFGEPT